MPPVTFKPLTVQVQGVKRWTGCHKSHPDAREAFRAQYCLDELQTAKFWTRLMQADDNGPRFWYRALTHQVVKVGLTKWYTMRNGWPVLRSYDQGQIGSCVGNADARRQCTTAALNIQWNALPESYPAMFDACWAYYTGRKVGGMIGPQDGSTGDAMAEGNKVYGALPMGIYGGVDCTVYTETRCRNWGAEKGIPQEARDHAAKHKYGAYALVSTFEQAWAACGNGIILNRCSGMGHEGSRDKYGAIKASGSWNHSMVLGESRYTTDSGEQLLLTQNSWGDGWCSGPYIYDQPEGSFYTYKADVNRLLAEGDTYVDTSYIGDPATIPTDFLEPGIWGALNLTWRGSPTEGSIV